MNKREKGTILIISTIIAMMLGVFSVILVDINFTAHIRNRVENEKFSSELLADTTLNASLAYMSSYVAPEIAEDEGEFQYYDFFYDYANDSSGLTPDPGSMVSCMVTITNEGDDIYKFVSTSNAAVDTTVQMKVVITAADLDLPAAFSMQVPPDTQMNLHDDDEVPIDFHGGNGVIDGRDHDANGNLLPVAGRDDKAGAAITTNADGNEIVPDDLTRVSGDPQVENSATYIGAALDALVEKARNNPDWSLDLSTDNGTVNANVGGPNDYQVGYVKTGSGNNDQSFHLSGQSNGYGVLVVDSDSPESAMQFLASGQFTWHGLIILNIEGDWDPGQNAEGLDLTGGGNSDSHIVGGVVIHVKGTVTCDDVNSSVLKIGGSAGSSLKYSSEAIQNSMDAFSGKIVNVIYYDMN